MRSLLGTAMILCVVGTPVPRYAAAVNCDQVRRYLSTGRSLQDVAESMVITVDEVRKCQRAGSAEDAPPQTAPTPGAVPKINY